jgi:apolipoprotein D and lipocalin family protein
VAILRTQNTAAFPAKKRPMTHFFRKVLRSPLPASLMAACLVLVGCTGIPTGLRPVTEFEPERYLGKWYEIARLDHRFERNLSNVSAFYDRKEGGGIGVVNRGFNEKSGKWEEIEGTAAFIKNESVGSLKVSFFGPFYGGYHIIALDRKTYDHAMVVGPRRSYLWILSRQKTLDQAVLAEMVATAARWGFDTQALIYVDQNRPDA